jgi:hypothetical protein
MAHPVSYSMGAGFISAGLKRLGHNVDYLPHSRAEGSDTSPPPRRPLGVNADVCLEECLLHAITEDLVG